MIQLWEKQNKDEIKQHMKQILISYLIHCRKYLKIHITEIQLQKSNNKKLYWYSSAIIYILEKISSKRKLISWKNCKKIKTIS